MYDIPIDPNDYTDITTALSIGDARKIPHKECSTSNCMKVSMEVEGTKYYCFKCGAYHFESSFNSPRERLRRNKAYKAIMRLKAEKNYSLPADFSHSLPPKGLCWLGKGGWTLNMTKQYNIGWSKELNRVILPVVDNCIHMGYTARAVDSLQKPKYLENVPGGTMWKSRHDPTEQPSACVLCEDILSAGRCGEFITAYSILGTSLDTSQLSEFIQYDRVLLWLDPDKGGIDGVKSIIHRLGMVTNVKVIKSEHDPKNLTNKVIRGYIEDIHRT